MRICLMKKALSIILCVLVLAAMLSSSAFAVVRTVTLSTSDKANNSLEVYGSWKLVRAYNSADSAYAVHVLPQYKYLGSWWTQKSSKIMLAMGKGICKSKGESKLVSSFEQADEFSTDKLDHETYWRLRLNVDGANRYGCIAKGTIRN